MNYSITANPALQWRDYLGVCKLKVVALIVFTALVGMFLAVPGMVPWQSLVFGTLGIGLAAASAAAINHVVDQHADALMKRTAARPVASGSLTGRNCLVFALVIGALAMWILVQFVNTLTAVLTFASLIGYAVVYTLYLKRATPQNIVIGGAAGAAPPVLGWTAVTGTVDPHALLLFLIIFVWTPPHFWALAIHRRNEYARADIPMLPVTHGVSFTRLQVLLYTILLVVVTVLPFITHMSGLLYLVGALALGAGFLYHAVALMRDDSDRQAMKTFGYSIVYLMALFAFLLVDHYLPLRLPYF
ncbi:MAG TPA: protoheme IX farnesyltransferase [Gammaproteobacteria bacterium]|nr:protoheme IX farnesyltransferase [Gammaproteobacteria bacterium]